MTPDQTTSKDKEKSQLGFILANIAQSLISSIPAALSAAEILYSIFDIINSIVLGAVGVSVFIVSARLMYSINQPDPMLEDRLTGLKKQTKDIMTGSYQPRTLEEIQQVFPTLALKQKESVFSRIRRTCRKNAFALSSILVGLTTTIAVISLGGTPLPFIMAIAVATPWVIGVAALVIPFMSLAIQWKLEKERVAMEEEVDRLRETKKSDSGRNAYRDKGRNTLATEITNVEEIQNTITATRAEAETFQKEKSKKDTRVKLTAGFVSGILGLMTGASIYAVIHAFAFPALLIAAAIVSPTGWIGIGIALTVVAGITILSYWSFKQSFKENEKYAEKITRRKQKLDTESPEEASPEAETPKTTAAKTTHSLFSFIKNPKILQPSLILLAGIAALVATAVVGAGLPLILIAAGTAAVVAAGTLYVNHYSKEQRILAEKLKCANELKEVLKTTPFASGDSSITSQNEGKAQRSPSSSSSSSSPTPSPSLSPAAAFFTQVPGSKDKSDDAPDGEAEGEADTGNTLKPD